jgi:hypothetical protein
LASLQDASGDKFVKAKEWQRAAIVGAEWILQSAKKVRPTLSLSLFE